MLEPSSGRAKISAVYRVKQPIENLKIRVRIVQQKSLLAELFENEGETRDSNFLEAEEREFSWQEKVLGPREARRYRDEGNCATDQQKAYHRRLLESPAAGSRLYSYVEADAHCPQAGPLAGCAFRSRLALRNERAAAPAPANRKPFAKRHNKSVVDERPSDGRVRATHYLYKERQAMHIVADLSPRDESSVDSEVLLCRLSYDPLRKTLRLSPDFSARDCYSVDGVGMSYDYWIEHVSPRPSARELQRRRDAAAKEARRLRALRDAQMFREMSAPQPRVLRLFLNLDIRSARDFAHDDALFVSYFLDLPEHWTSAGRPAGRTQRCRARDGAAHFAYSSEVVLDLDQDAAAASGRWPSLLFSVGSIDSWTRYRLEGYGWLALPTDPGSFGYELATWRPAGGLLDSLRRFFTGGACELDDISYCAVPAMQHEAGSLDKRRLRVLPSGSLQLSVHTAHQSRHPADCRLRRRRRRGDGLAAPSAADLLHGADDVLARFKAARERMIQARAMYPS
ncbi:tectonic-like complex member MKS1 isoform X2 [Phymastichus coffea]|uniref:tectonic-like complex member MKS1 isoform X2 n=1 Tax=Phymastichus coffea TaxID=108790 RepID=UPI00273BBD47|nr:tectonic-like complex member MKS1 isoform X2 [Phymastichus coffea]